jgi:PhnB protein
MASVSTYLNFAGNTETAFLFYRDVFGGDFTGPIMRYGDMPAEADQPPLSEADQNKVMHVELPLLGDHSLMGTDMLESMGFTVIQGNNVQLTLRPDTRLDTERLFNALAVNAEVETPLQDMFWGSYYGSLTDQFGTRWMFNCDSKV